MQDTNSNVVCDILLRLPVKSLLISDQSVRTGATQLMIILSLACTLHLLHSISVMILNQKFLLHWVLEKPCIHLHTAISTMHSLPILDVSKIEENYIVYCVAYGLLCFQNLDHQEKVYSCNPLRREIVELPRPSLCSGWVRFGVGFDHTINTYKIIRVTARKAFDGDLYDKFEVYTLGSNSWREVSPPLPFYHHLFNKWGVSAHGDIHWLLYLSEAHDG